MVKRQGSGGEPASEAALDATFQALSDPTRRAILDRLAREGDATVGEIAAPFAMSLPAVSKHLTVLEDAGLVARERRGRERVCRLRARPIREASNWMARYRRFWGGRLDALEAHLARSGPDAGPAPDHDPREE